MEIGDCVCPIQPESSWNSSSLFPDMCLSSVSLLLLPLFLHTCKGIRVFTRYSLLMWTVNNILNLYISDIFFKEAQCNFLWPWGRNWNTDEQAGLAGCGAQHWLPGGSDASLGADEVWSSACTGAWLRPQVGLGRRLGTRRGHSTCQEYGRDWCPRLCNQVSLYLV